MRRVKFGEGPTSNQNVVISTNATACPPSASKCKAKAESKDGFAKLERGIDEYFARQQTDHHTGRRSSIYSRREKPKPVPPASNHLVERLAGEILSRTQSHVSAELGANAVNTTTTVSAVPGPAGTIDFQTVPPPPPPLQQQFEMERKMTPPELSKKLRTLVDKQKERMNKTELPAAYSEYGPTVDLDPDAVKMAMRCAYGRRQLDPVRRNIFSKEATPLSPNVATPQQAPALMQPPKSSSQTKLNAFKFQGDFFDQNNENLMSPMNVVEDVTLTITKRLQDLNALEEQLLAEIDHNY